MTDMAELGDKYSIVKVKPGYARNYLIPKGFAQIATPSLKKHIMEISKQKEQKERRIREQYIKMAEKLKGAIIKIPVKASPSGKIFGSVSNIQVADVLNSMGYSIPRQNIKIHEGEIIKEVGEYNATITVYKDITADVKIKVVVE